MPAANWQEEFLLLRDAVVAAMQGPDTVGSLCDVTARLVVIPRDRLSARTIGVLDRLAISTWAQLHDAARDNGPELARELGGMPLAELIDVAQRP